MRALLFALVLAAAPLRAGELSDLVMAPGLFQQTPPGEVLRYRLSRSLPTGAEPAKGQINAPPVISDADLVLIAQPLEGRPVLLLTLEQDGKQHFVSQFPAEGANPVLLYFLENVVRSTAALTGGSPFYIKNRLLEAMVGAELSPHQPHLSQPPSETPSLPGSAAAPDSPGAGGAPLPGQAPGPDADGSRAGGSAGGGAYGAAPAVMSIELHPFADDPNQARLKDLALLRLRFGFDPAAPGRLLTLKADTEAGSAGYTETLELTSEAK